MTVTNDRKVDGKKKLVVINWQLYLSTMQSVNERNWLVIFELWTRTFSAGNSEQ